MAIRLKTSGDGRGKAQLLILAALRFQQGLEFLDGLPSFDCRRARYSANDARLCGRNQNGRGGFH